MLEWIGSFSLWRCLLFGIIFMFGLIWLIYEFYCAPTREEHKRESDSAKTPKSESSCDYDFEEEQLTLKIYQLSHQLDEVLAHRRYEEARLIADEMEAALDRFIIVKQTETIIKH